MSSIKKILLSLVILFVLCGDSIGLASEYAILKAPPGFTYNETNSVSTLAIQIPGMQQIDLSLPKLLFYFFYSGGVFNQVATNNIDYAIYGLPNGAKPGSEWIDLGNLKDCFPYPLGETYIRLDIEWHKLLGDKVYKQAMDNLLTKIRVKYNRDNPKKQIQKVALYQMWWPRSEQSYTALRYPANTHWQLMAAEGH